MFADKTILVTGGTGSFGNTFIRQLLETHNDFRRVIVYSRDEKKQYDMRLALNDPRIQYRIGDVRDRDAIFTAMQGVNYVFHAAALKHVPSCEFYPLEAIKTNVLGSNNVLDAAESNGVERVVVLSTDKAVYPINAMGISKAMMEKLMTAKGVVSRSATVFCAVRYGNVMYSRGSVIPLFVRQIKSGKPITLTDPDMTRFLLPLRQTVDLVLFALKNGDTGDIFVRKAPASTVFDLAKACLNVFDANNEIITIGVREGEKMHETLVTQEELARAQDFGDYYRVISDRLVDYDKYLLVGNKGDFPAASYTSENTTRLSIWQIEKLLLSLPEIQHELGIAVTQIYQGLQPSSFS